MKKNQSILLKLRLAMMAFGIFMGIVFPLYASFFVNWKEGMLIWFVAGCLLAGIMVGLVGYWFVKIILIKKLKRVSWLAIQLKNRDISRNIHLESKDEVGEIVNGLNAAIQNIRFLFNEIFKIFALSDELLSSVDNSKIEDDSAVEKINHRMEEVTQNVKHIEELSEKIEQVVIEGKNITDSTRDQQLSTVNKVLEFSSIMDSLVEKSRRINEILKIIEGIAGETNILSLNASVEAARAGEYGKGFAVVAAEIRKLATSTAESSQVIIQNISAINADVEKAYKAVEDISKAVKQNNTDINSINNHFGHIDDAIRENLNSTFRLKGSVTDLNQSFQVVRDIFSQLKGCLMELNGLVAAYKI